MIKRPGRRGLAVVLGCCLLAAAAAVLLVGGSGTGARPSARTRPPALRVLQLNLCNSGIAACYTGRSVRRAAAVIRAQRPDVVTLNEVCRDDVTALERSMGGGVVSAFRAALDRRDGHGMRCRNGRPYGIGVLLRRSPPNRGERTYAGVYPAQDTGDPEERVWLCVHALTAYYACVTHLASTSTSVALAQCRYLLDAAVPAVRRDGGSGPVLLGADLNLGSAVRSCLPRGDRQAGDGGVQHVVTSPEFVIGSARTVGMDGTTDHPGLLVDLVRR